MPTHPSSSPTPGVTNPHLDHEQEQLPSTQWQPMAEANKDGHHEAREGDHPRTFYQRYFTKPVVAASEKQHPNKSNRAFSFRSRGALITACVMLVILFGVIGAAVGVTLTRAHETTNGEDGTPESHKRPPYRGTPEHPVAVKMVLDDNFPDPTLWRDGETWYAYATNNAAGILKRPDNASSYEYGVSNIQIAKSTDFLNWTLLNSSHDPLPDTGRWVVQGRDNFTDPPIPRANVWAPSVARISRDSEQDQYIMYYTAARNRLLHPGIRAEGTQEETDRSAFLPRHPAPHCIGAATASSPTGPFKPIPTVLACPIERGGAIDPAAFTDTDQTPYLLYKVDGNNIGHGGMCGNTVKPRVPTPIMLQKLEADGLTPVGPPKQLLDRTADDGPLVEAPDLVRSQEGIYFLFFSSGCTRAPSYDLKYATADNINGPYVRADKALLRTGDWDLHAPGSAGLFPDGEGKYNIVFHARVQAEQGRVRAMYVGKLALEGRTASFVPV